MVWLVLEEAEIRTGHHHPALCCALPKQAAPLLAPVTPVLGSLAEPRATTKQSRRQAGMSQCVYYWKHVCRAHTSRL